eukprot:gnl/Dysnectes_brevis/6058_a9116_372.p1 GENE.gnl/Dysnectes_brevis/6058_a9116_372~~gnl/Dysnectes_brevis/6058_a9116_372.p1  ORF type:complete len:622 (+),score=197.51 gnl/Dysnectes_brevis/6058_a9116_372:158-2023(+)
MHFVLPEDKQFFISCIISPQSTHPLPSKYLSQFIIYLVDLNFSITISESRILYKSLQVIQDDIYTFFSKTDSDMLSYDAQFIHIPSRASLPAPTNPSSLDFIAPHSLITTPPSHQPVSVCFGFNFTCKKASNDRYIPMAFIELSNPALEVLPPLIPPLHRLNPIIEATSLASIELKRYPQILSAIRLAVTQTQAQPTLEMDPGFYSILTHQITALQRHLHPSRTARDYCRVIAYPPFAPLLYLLQRVAEEEGWSAACISDLLLDLAGVEYVLFCFMTALWPPIKKQRPKHVPSHSGLSVNLSKKRRRSSRSSTRIIQLHIPPSMVTPEISDGVDLEISSAHSTPLFSPVSSHTAPGSRRSSHRGSLLFPLSPGEGQVGSGNSYSREMRSHTLPDPPLKKRRASVVPAVSCILSDDTPLGVASLNSGQPRRDNPTPRAHIQIRPTSTRSAKHHVRWGFEESRVILISLLDPRILALCPPRYCRLHPLTFRAPTSTMNRLLITLHREASDRLSLALPRRTPNTLKSTIRNNYDRVYRNRFAPNYMWAVVLRPISSSIFPVYGLLAHNPHHPRLAEWKGAVDRACEALKEWLQGLTVDSFDVDELDREALDDLPVPPFDEDESM